MQITQKFQRVLDIFVKVLKFVWRHLFTLAMFAILVDIIYEKNTPLIERELLVFAIAALLDWFKMKWKISSGDDYHSNSPITSQTFCNQPDWNGRVAGTAGYLGAIGEKYPY